MTNKEMIEKRCGMEGLSIQGWTTTDDGETAKLGRFLVTEGRENDGLFKDDEGELVACVVGSEKYSNQRVAFSFTPDDYDEGSDVPDLSVLEPI